MRYTVSHAAIAVFVALQIGSAQAQPTQYVMHSNAMLPEIAKGDIVECSRQKDLPRPGHVIVYRHPKKDSYNISLLAAYPGSKVQMKAGVLHINGKKAKLSAVPDSKTKFLETLPFGSQNIILNTDPAGPTDFTPEFTVPQKHVFVIGLNRDNAIDSRDQKRHGFVPRANIVCKIARGRIKKP